MILYRLLGSGLADFAGCLPLIRGAKATCVSTLCFCSAVLCRVCESNLRVSVPRNDSWLLSATPSPRAPYALYLLLFSV